jgi:hypothetical protein
MCEPQTRYIQDHFWSSSPRYVSPFKHRNDAIAQEYLDRKEARPVIAAVMAAVDRELSIAFFRAIQNMRLSPETPRNDDEAQKLEHELHMAALAAQVRLGGRELLEVLDDITDRFVREGKDPLFEMTFWDMTHYFEPIGPALARAIADGSISPDEAQAALQRMVDRVLHLHEAGAKEGAGRKRDTDRTEYAFSNIGEMGCFAIIPLAAAAERLLLQDRTWTIFTGSGRSEELDRKTLITLMFGLRKSARHLAKMDSAPEAVDRQIRGLAKIAMSAIRNERRIFPFSGINRDDHDYIARKSRECLKDPAEEILSLLMDRFPDCLVRILTEDRALHEAFTAWSDGQLVTSEPR